MRSLFRNLSIVLTLVLGLIALGIAGMETRWFKNWLRGYIVREAGQYLNGDLTIARLGGNLFSTVEVEDIRLRLAGQDVVTIDSAHLRYNLWQIISTGASIDELRLARPRIHLRRDGDAWTISRIVRKQEKEADREAPARPIAIDDVQIAGGTIIFEDLVEIPGVVVPRRIEKLDAAFVFKYAPVHYSLDIRHVSFRAAEPELALNELKGGLAVRDDNLYLNDLIIRTAQSSLDVGGTVEHYLSKPVAKLTLNSEKLSLPEIARIVPALEGIDLEPAVTLNVNGPIDAAALDLQARSTAGTLSASLLAGRQASSVTLKGEIDVKHLDLAPWTTRREWRSDLSGRIKADLRSSLPPGGMSAISASSFHGKLHVETPAVSAMGYRLDRLNADATLAGPRITLNARTSAYGVRATSSGTLTIARPAASIRYDLRGQLAAVNLSRLPGSLNVPPVSTDLNADYHVRGVATEFTMDARFRPSRVEKTTIADGSTATLAIGSGRTAYSADVTLAALNPRAMGEAFHVPALTDPRYDAALNGHVTLQGRGTRFDDLVLQTEGTLADSEVAAGMVPSLTFSASVDHRTIRAILSGRVVDLDPSRLGAPSTLAGRVTGAFDADVTRDAAASDESLTDGLTASIRATFEPSALGPVQIDKATVDGTLRGNIAEVRELVVDGADVHLDAKGTISLGDAGQSNLAFNADSTDFKSIAAAFGEDATGIGKVSGRVEGNRADLKVTGNLVANGLEYRNMQALTLTSDYVVRIPGLDWKRATAETRDHATFVVLAGQEINEFEGKVDYDQQLVKFDVTAKQPDRSMTSTGSVRLMTDQQEIRLEQLALQAQAGEWRIEQPAGIDYSQASIAVHDLVLVSGTQKLAINGRFGRSGEKLSAALTDVELVNVEALLLRQPQFSGRLNLWADVTGTRENPYVEVTYQVDGGAFRDFRYEQFRGWATYMPAGVTLYAWLQQNPDAWLNADGFVPRAALVKLTGGEAAPPPQPGALSDYDMRIITSAIDLGLVQGFTTALTDVHGVLQADVKVTGPADSPQPNGAVSITNGAFLVEATGVGYQNLNGRLDLAGDRLRIEDLRIHDSGGDEMVVSGELAVRERQVSGVNIAVKSNRFKILQNEMGQLQIRSDLKLGGDLEQPRIEGELGVSTGRLNLDAILASVASSPYDVKETQYEIVGPQQEKKEERPSAPAQQTSVFDRLTADVHFTVPDDLVVLADDLRTPGASLGLGTINVTVGGDLQVQKGQRDIPRIVGTVNTVRGTYDFQGRRFEILRDGTVRFDGLDVIDPTLDIRARRIIQAVEANISIRGTLSDPRLELSSIPPLEQSDILALVVFNQPLNQLGEGAQTTLSERATAMATGALAGQLAGSIGKALNLDTFDIQTPQGDNGVQLTAGQQLGKRAFIRLQQSLGADQNQSNVVFEYQFLEWLRLESNFLTGAPNIQQSLVNRTQSSGADLVIQFPRAR